MRVTTWKCDGCKAFLSEGDASRERCFTLSTPFNERDLDLCRECWRKMCAAIGIEPSPDHRVGDTDELGALRKRVAELETGLRESLRLIDGMVERPAWFEIGAIDRLRGLVPG